jgi:putative Ca2+/H+ antiporter (TMEM165/GDT1 family)
LEPLLTSFIAAGLGEWGDATQLLVVGLAARFGRPGQILLGVALAAFATMLIAAAGGILVHDGATLRAFSLLVGVVLLFAGAMGLVKAKPPPLADTVGGGPFLAAAMAFFIVGLGDRTQFITFAIAARFDSLLLAALGATAGIVAANVPAAVLGPALLRQVPVKTIRLSASALFLLVGFYLSISALRLV